MSSPEENFFLVTMQAPDKYWEIYRKSEGVEVSLITSLWSSNSIELGKATLVSANSFIVTLEVRLHPEYFKLKTKLMEKTSIFRGVWVCEEGKEFILDSVVLARATL